MNEKMTVQTLVNTEAKKEEFAPEKLSAIFIVSCLFSFMFTFCFVGFDIKSSLSSLLFFNVAVALLYYLLKKTGSLLNKKAFIIAVPIFALSCMNSIFMYSYYNIFNCIAFFVLYSVMFVKATRPDKKIQTDTLLSVVLNNCFTATEKIITNRIKLNKKSVSIFVGLLVSVPVLLILTVLLASSDEIFSQILDSIFRAVALDLTSLHLKLFVFAFVFVYMCGFLFYSIKKRDEIVFGIDNPDNTLSIAFLTPVNMLFLFFCITQLGYLGSGKTLSSPSDYSTFARDGFFKLLLVTVINLIIVLIFTEIVKNLKNKALKFSLVALCTFTLILIASSLYRVFVYINAFGLTPLRVEVTVFLLAEIFPVIYTIRHIIKEKGNIVPFILLSGTAALLLLNVIARPYFCNRVNYAVRFPNYSTIRLYEYGSEDIPLLKEMYEKEENKEKKRRIMESMEKYQDSLKGYTDGHWQNINLQAELYKSFVLRNH